MTVRISRLILIILLMSLMPWSTAYTEISQSSEVSKYTSDVSALTYPPAKQINQAVDLSWDFSAEKTYAFEMTQETYATTDFGMKKDDSGPDQAFNGFSADVLVKSQGNGIARLVYQNIVVTMEVQTPDGPEKMSQKHPAKVAGEMSEKSRDPESRNPTEEPPEDMFPLPAFPLKVGETSSYAVQLPFNAMGSLLHVDGEERITLSGFVMRDGILCAQIDFTQEVNDLDKPPEVEGDYYFNQKIRGRAFFDLAGRRFVEVIMAARNVMKISSSSPEVSFSGDKDMGKELPDKVKMSMDSDSIIRLVEK